MISVRFNLKTAKSKQIMKLFKLAQASNQTIRVNTPFGSYYLENSQKRNQDLDDKQMLKNRYRRSRQFPPFMI